MEDVIINLLVSNIVVLMHLRWHLLMYVKCFHFSQYFDVYFHCRKSILFLLIENSYLWGKRHLSHIYFIIRLYKYWHFFEHLVILYVKRMLGKLFNILLFHFCIIEMITITQKMVAILIFYCIRTAIWYCLWFG